jgi:hypothetical protein
MMFSLNDYNMDSLDKKEDGSSWNSMSTTDRHWRVVIGYLANSSEIVRVTANRANSRIATESPRIASQSALIEQPYRSTTTSSAGHLMERSRRIVDGVSHRRLSLSILLIIRPRPFGSLIDLAALRRVVHYHLS